MYPGLLARGAAKLAPTIASGQGGSFTLMGQGLLSGTLSTAARPQFGSHWSTLPREVQRLWGNNSEIAWGCGGSFPPSQALHHHFLHHHLCIKDPQPKILSGGRLPSLCLFPLLQPTKVGTSHSRMSSTLSTTTSLSPIWLRKPSSEGATTAAPIHPVPSP